VTVIRSPERVCLVCFTILFLTGGLFLLIGLIVVPARPHFQLDVVLTQEELADKTTRDATLSLLKRLNESSNEWRLWTLGGLLVTLTSAIGLGAATELWRRSRWAPWGPSGPVKRP
jgi:hypothetical protein